VFLPKKVLAKKLLKYLEEDVGQGDITTHITIPENTIVEAEVVTKEEGVVAGIEEILALSETLNLQAAALTSDGAYVKPKTPIIRLIGNARTLLSAERTMLNILSRMSGIATMTRNLVNKVGEAGLKTRIASTRKTAPGLRYFDKKAVSIGDGDTHRLHLDDLVLIKDNHLKVVGGVTSVVEKVRRTVSFSKKIEIEVTSPKEALEAARAGADIILLDNLSPSEVRETTLLLTKEGVRNKVLLESSGRITGKNILEYAATGVDIVSVGQITHSTKALDLSLEIVKVINDD